MCDDLIQRKEERTKPDTINLIFIASNCYFLSLLCIWSEVKSDNTKITALGFHQHFQSW